MTFDISADVVISADDFKIEAYGTVTNPDAEAELVIKILRAADCECDIALTVAEVQLLADLLR